MRQLLVLGIVLLLAPLAFFAPFAGLIGYIWIAYVRPHEWAWMPTAQISLAVAVATLCGYVVFELTRRAPQLIPNALILLLWGQITLASLLANSPPAAREKLIEFSKTFLIALLITAMVDSRKRARWFLLGLVLSIGFLAFRSNAGLVLALGQTRIFGPGGAFEDNNDYALLLNTAAPIAFFVARGETIRWLRWICYSLSIMMGVTVLFTLSRGGYLGLCAVILAIAFRSRFRLAGLALVLILGLASLTVLPQRIIERAGSIRTASETDESARLRFEAWSVSLRIIKDHPVFGVGPRNMLEVYTSYLETENIRVSHNSFLQMGVDAGVPGLLLFLSLIGVSYCRLRRARRIWLEKAPDSPLIVYSAGLEVALLGYLVSANFLSRHDLELLYQIAALATAFHIQAREENQ
ncbi:MAG: putative O-glycosylation ligase, exosortase A system-associated [Acidobacteriota bacterium]|nr:MAG: putative O-glycosylation ligase, exosortase A system-associated [Acidobacteriota bacterium]